jgi:hypothetical protein
MKTQKHCLAGGLLLLLVAGAVAGQAKPQPSKGHPTAGRWIGPDGQPLPFANEEQVLEFLRTAKVMRTSGTGRGITHPQKVLLEKDGIRAHAIFHNIDEEKSMVKLRSETVMQFRDTYLFQIAAYELSRLVGLNVVPPSVKRRLHGEPGSLTMWLEGMITDEDRQKQNREAPDPVRWHQQLHNMRTWDNLIYNFDRNQGNLLIDKEWNLWLIDHTRAFRRTADLPKPELVRGCDRRLYEGMRALTKQAMEQHLRGLLRPSEITFLLKRRDQVVARLDSLIAQQGEDKVLFDLPIRAAAPRP